MKFFFTMVSAIILVVSLLIGFYNKDNQKNLKHREVLKYWPFVQVMWNKNDNLRTMKRVFGRFGHEMVNGSIDPHWDVLWSIEYPFIIFSNQMKNLMTHQKVNHFPGISYITLKSYMTTRNRLKFIPAAFEFPYMYKEFESYVKQNPNKKFVTKYEFNRGVKIVSVDEIFKTPNLASKGRFIQEFLDNPFLIDGHAFDIGIYVLITSINPLRLYRYRNEILLRFCPESYHPFDADNIEKYVVYETQKTIFEMPSLKSMVGKMGFSFKASFDTHLKSRGVDVKALWNQFDDAIVSLVLRNEKNLIKDTSKFWSSDNFFELLRFDFMIDEAANVHLIEVNMSPNLTPAHDRFEGHAVGYEQIVFNTLECVMGISSYSNHHVR